MSTQSQKRFIGLGAITLGLGLLLLETPANAYIQSEIPLSQRRFLQALNVERRRLAGESARGDETVAVSEARVAGSAEDVEALAATGQNFFGYGEGHDVAGVVADLAGVEVGVLVKLSAGDGAVDGRSGGALPALADHAGPRR